MINENLEIITGLLGCDPYLAYTKKGNPVCEISLGLKNFHNETIWKKIVVFGKLAELCKVHLKKGNRVFVHGQKQLRRFTTHNGLEKEVYEIRAFALGQSLI